MIIVSMSHFSLGAYLTWPSPALSDLALSNVTLVDTELALTTVQMDMTGKCFLASVMNTNFLVLGPKNGSGLGWIVCFCHFTA